MNLQDIERILALYGFLLARIRGSHRHYRRADGVRLTFATKRKKLSPEQIDYILHDLRRAMQKKHR